MPQCLNLNCYVISGFRFKYENHRTPDIRFVFGVRFKEYCRLLKDEVLELGSKFVKA